MGTQQRQNWTARQHRDTRLRTTMDALNQRSSPPWPLLLALAAIWFAITRMLSPQWSVYPQYNYGWAVPFLCVYLSSLRWNDRPEWERPRSPGGACAGIVLAGLLLFPIRIIVEANPIWRAGSWAISLLMVSAT